MGVCAACGCSLDERPDLCGSARDSVSVVTRGVAADSSRVGVFLPQRSPARTLRKRRESWMRLTGPQRIRRILLYGMGPLMLMVIPWMLVAPTDDQYGPCPADGTPTAESVPAILDDSGSVEKLDLTDRSLIAVTVYASQQNNGGQVDLRRQMGRLMRGLHQVAVCFPSVKTIRAELMAPGETRHDEYGNGIPGSEVQIVSLAIAADDLRAFRQDFEWESYAVYAANRYARAINLNFRDVWHRELEREEEIGDFVNSL